MKKSEVLTLISLLLLPHSFMSNFGGAIIFAHATRFPAGGGFWLNGNSHSNVGIVIAVTAIAGIALAATLFYSHSLNTPGSRWKRKHALLRKQWEMLFDSDGRLSDGGLKLLKKVRSGGVDPSLRAEVWPFLLGVYNLNSSKAERESIRTQKRKEYENIRRRCRKIEKQKDKSAKLNETRGNNEDNGEFIEVLDSPGVEEDVSAKGLDEVSPAGSDSDHPVCTPALQSSNSLVELEPDDDKSGITCENSPVLEVLNAKGSLSLEGVSPAGPDSDHPVYTPSVQSSNSLVEPDDDKSGITSENSPEPDTDSSDSDSNSSENIQNSSISKSHPAEGFSTWQQIIRLDAVRANAEWIAHSPSQATVSEIKARHLAQSVGLKDYDHLEPCRIFHAARLVAILEAYALYDSEIGYCQGMSDLLSPIISVMEEDHDAFWCFVGFMKKARHNFRLDEVGIRRQLNIVSKIIKGKDSHLYRHLEKLRAEDCFFVYRMVVVLFRRELSFEQTLCLWEVMWTDQAAIRAGIDISDWGRMRMRAPPTDDLLLYAIAACVLQRRKLIVEKYNEMDEILRECNNMAGNLDVWRLLDDAHDLVVNLHGKI